MYSIYLIYRNSEKNGKQKNPQTSPASEFTVSTCRSPVLEKKTVDFMGTPKHVIIVHCSRSSYNPPNSDTPFHSHLW